MDDFITAVIDSCRVRLRDHWFFISRLQCVSASILDATILIITSHTIEISHGTQQSVSKASSMDDEHRHYQFLRKIEGSPLLLLKKRRFCKWWKRSTNPCLSRFNICRFLRISVNTCSSIHHHWCISKGAVEGTICFVDIALINQISTVECSDKQTRSL